MSKLDASLHEAMIQTEFGRISGKWFAWSTEAPGLTGTGEDETAAKLDLVERWIDWIDKRTTEIMSKYLKDEPLDGDE
jgi:hypothetical protein